MLLVHDLRAEGMQVALAAGKLLVSPSNRITEQLRARIKLRRQDAVEYLILESRITAMAARWNYTADELTESLAGCGLDPDSWQRWVSHDELTFPALHLDLVVGHA